MDWYKLSIRMSDFSIQKALDILELSPGATEQEVKAARNRLAKKYHSDKGGNHDRIVDINVAFEYLEDHDFNTGRNDSVYRVPVWDENGKRKSWQEEEEEALRNRGVPPWQTDARSSNNINEDAGYLDMNACKRDIYRESIKNGNVFRYQLWSFDGRYFRDTMPVFANESAFYFAADVFYIWCRKQPKAIFIQRWGTRKLTLINVDGHDAPLKEYEYDYPNGNPSNDSKFVELLRDEFSG